MVFLFHMPMFFFIGGYLFSPAAPREYLRRKAIHILIPYLFFLVTICLPYYLIGSGETFSAIILKLIVGGRSLNGVGMAFWFPACFFLTQQAFNLLVWYKVRPLLVVMGFSLALAYANYLLCPALYIPWDANVVLYALPLFWCGYALKGNPEADRCVTGRPRWLPVAMITGLLVAKVVYPPLNMLYVDMRVALYGIPILSFIGGFVAIAGIISVSLFVVRHMPLLRWFLELCGRASMVVMYLHIAIAHRLEFMDSIPGGGALIQIVLCLGIFLLIDRWMITRRIVLGVEKPQTAGLWKSLGKALGSRRSEIVS